MAKKVVIGGCRDYADYVFFKSRIDELLKGEKDEIIIISGHCSGIDLMGESLAKSVFFLAKRSTWRRSAFFRVPFSAPRSAAALP